MICEKSVNFVKTSNGFLFLKAVRGIFVEKKIRADELRRMIDGIGLNSVSECESMTF